MWAPSRISTLFAPNRHQPKWAAAESVYVMKGDGSDIAPLTETWGMPPYAWSPDGQWIAYTNSFVAAVEIFIMDHMGFNVMPLMEVNEGFHPLWRS
jgi:Tol biopolymer transport system component